MFPVILHSIILCENNVLASGEILQLNAQQYIFDMGPRYYNLTFFFFFFLITLAIKTIEPGYKM